MNQIGLIGCKDVKKFIRDLVQGFKSGDYYISQSKQMIIVQNRYFKTNLNFVVQKNDEANVDLHAHICFENPKDYTFHNSDNLQVVIAMIKEGQDGAYDEGDTVFDYVLDYDELAELLMQTAWPIYEKVSAVPKKQTDKQVEQQPSTNNIDELIEQIDNQTIKNEVIKVQNYLKNQENDTMEDFANAFSLIEGLQGMLKSCSDSDRKIAALVVASLIGSEFSDDGNEEN